MPDMEAISLLTCVMNCCEVVLHFNVLCLLIVFCHEISIKSYNQHNLRPKKKYMQQHLNVDSVVFNQIKSRNSTQLKLVIVDQHQNSTIHNIITHTRQIETDYRL